MTLLTKELIRLLLTSTIIRPIITGAVNCPIPFNVNAKPDIVDACLNKNKKIRYVKIEMDLMPISKNITLNIARSLLVRTYL